MSLQTIVATTTIMQMGVSGFRGGRYGDLTRGDNIGDGLDAHHIPDRNADPRVSVDDGPAIQMDPADHMATSSWGRRGTADAYREETAEMIRQGRYRDAMAREIRDVRRAAQEESGNPRKYNQAIREMLEYARRAGLLPDRDR